MNSIELPPEVSLSAKESPLTETSATREDCSDLEFTGERMIPGQVEFHLEAEHRARYEFAATQLPRGRVLDNGCGVGYGSRILARHGLEVVGIDVDPKAVGVCRQTHSVPSITFQQEDSAHLSFPDRHFDGVVSFEVIEHIPNYHRYLTEAHRVLRPGGVLIISTPNKRVYTDIPHHHNPFHVHEFYLAEFRELLTSFFPTVEIIGQWNAEAIVIGPAGQAQSGLCAEWLLRTSRGLDSDLDPLEQAGYFVATCRKAGPSEKPLKPVSGHCFVTGLCHGVAPVPAAQSAVVVAKTEVNAGPIRFRQGFYPDEGGWRWMGAVGKLQLPAQSTPVRVSFNLTASKLSFYERRPLQVNVLLNKRPIRTEVFTRDEESRCVDLLIPKTASDVTIELASTGIFLPSQCGWPADKRELSVRLGQLKLEARNTELANAPTPAVSAKVPKAGFHCPQQRGATSNPHHL